MVKNYPKKKQPTQQQPPNCPSCKRLEFDKGYYCQFCEYVFVAPKHQIDKEVRRQNHFFSTKIPYASRKITEIFYSMANTAYNSTADMINKLQFLKGETKLKFYKNTVKY